jgi:hypothetical protein
MPLAFSFPPVWHRQQPQVLKKIAPREQRLTPATHFGKDSGNVSGKNGKNIGNAHQVDQPHDDNRSGNDSGKISGKDSGKNGKGDSAARSSLSRNSSHQPPTAIAAARIPAKNRQRFRQYLRQAPHRLGLANAQPCWIQFTARQVHARYTQTTSHIEQ